ncbi:MAG: hypothetical protein HZB50_10960 [Chloroflexi bacterium]|nr:hypothetical protein [Chloroflexota bacterium]
MADISAIFFILLIISVAFPSMLTLWWLLFPPLVARAQVRVEKTLGGTFWMGLGVMIALAIPIVILLVLPFGPAKFLGWVLLAASFAVSSIGSAGISSHLSEQMKRAGSVFSPLAGFIRGAVILELTSFLPVIGWFFLLPIAVIISFGAASFALLNWMPREKTQSTPNETAPSHA